MRDNTTLFPEMLDTANGKRIDCTKRKLSSPFPRCSGRKKKLKEEPELPSHHDEHRGNPAQTHQAPAGKSCPGVFLRWGRLFLPVVLSYVSETCLVEDPPVLAKSMRLTG